MGMQASAIDYDSSPHVARSFKTSSLIPTGLQAMAAASFQAIANSTELSLLNLNISL